MVGLGGSRGGADTLADLLKVLADPKQYGAALDDLRTAAREADDRQKDAAAKLKEAQDLSADLAGREEALQAARAEFDAFASGKGASLAAREAKLAEERQAFERSFDAKQSEFDAREADLTRRETAVESGEQTIAVEMKAIEETLARAEEREEKARAREAEYHEKVSGLQKVMAGNG